MTSVIINYIGESRLRRKLGYHEKCEERDEDNTRKLHGKDRKMKKNVCLCTWL